MKSPSVVTGSAACCPAEGRLRKAQTTTTKREPRREQAFIMHLFERKTSIIDRRVSFGAATGDWAPGRGESVQPGLRPPGRPRSETAAPQRRQISYAAC